MSLERWAALYSFVCTFAVFLYLRRVSIDVSGTPGGEFLAKALDSWFLRARWSPDAQVRIKRMAYATLLIAIVALVFFIIDPKPRYAQ